MFTKMDTINTESALDVSSATVPTTTSLKLRCEIIIGKEMPRYANTKFSQMYPAVSIRYSIVICPHGLSE